MLLLTVHANVFKYVLVVSLLFMWIIKVYKMKKTDHCCLNVFITLSTCEKTINFYQ